MITNLLLDHLGRYPLMELQDCAVLLYESEYGLKPVLDEGKVKAKLLQEMSTAPQNVDPLYVGIGNGLCRVNLFACKEKGIDAEDVFRLSQPISNARQADSRALEEDLKEMKKLVQDGTLPFDCGMMDYLLILYRDGDLSLFSHSKAYCRVYHPAYRIAPQKQVKAFLRTRVE